MNIQRCLLQTTQYIPLQVPAKCVALEVSRLQTGLAGKLATVFYHKLTVFP